MKTWKPDTCDCHVEEIYDGIEIIGMGAILNKCVVHADLTDEELYDVILNKENRVKNGVHRMLLGGHEEVGDVGLHEHRIDPNSKQLIADLKPGISYEWSFSGAGRERRLHAKIVGAKLADHHKSKIQAVCDKDHGSGKVVFE